MLFLGASRLHLHWIALQVPPYKHPCFRAQSGTWQGIRTLSRRDFTELGSSYFCLGVPSEKRTGHWPLCTCALPSARSMKIISRWDGARGAFWLAEGERWSQTSSVHFQRTRKYPETIFAREEMHVHQTKSRSLPVYGSESRPTYPADRAETLKDLFMPWILISKLLIDSGNGD